MRLTVDPIWAVIGEAEEAELAELHDLLSWRIKGAEHSAPFQAGHWDGRKSLLDRRKWRFPAGLVGMVQRALPVEIETPAPVAPVPGPPRTLPGVTWRPEQVTALAALHRHVRGIVQMTVGRGKGELMIAQAAAWPRPSLILVHTQDLFRQNLARLSERLPHERIGTLRAGAWAPIWHGINVGMFESIYSRIGETAPFLRAVQTLIVDECHHAPAATFNEVLAMCPAPWRTGYSATPFEKDPGGRPRTMRDAQLVGALGEMIFEFTQYAVEVRIQIAEFQSTVHPQTKFAIAYVNDILENQLAQAFVGKWVRGQVRRGRHGVLLASRRVHSMTLAAAIGAVYLDGTVKAQERQAAIAAFNRREIPVLNAVRTMNEGLNLPAMDWLGLVDPGRDWRGLVQKIGRAARERPDKTFVDVLVLQVVGHPKLARHAKDQLRVFRQEGFTINVLGRWGDPFRGFRRAGGHQNV